MRTVVIVGAYVSMAVATMASTLPGCEGEPYYTCDGPIEGRRDTYGRPDPCCNFAPCCPNPLLSHWQTLPNVNPPGSEVYWDPCCMAHKTIDLTPCPPGYNANLPPDAGSPSDTDKGDAGSDGQSSCTEPCTGECISRADIPAAGPFLFWSGPAGQAPSCPHGTTSIAGKKYADLNIPPLDCPSCSCDPPTGTCELPSTATASSGSCSAPNAIRSDTNLPPNWDGSCTSANAIAAGALCNGVPCVKSLTVAPLKLTESGCTPRMSAPPKEPPAPSWQSSTVMCSLGPCDGGNRVCVPPAEARPFGWETCLALAGDAATCSDPYPVRHVVYDSFTDGRTCGTCACAPPLGSYCISTLAVSEGAACKGSAAIPGTLITSQEQPFCFDLPAGVALGSKTMTPPRYTPGSCETISKDGSGEVTQQGAVTLCCRKPEA